MARRLGEAPRDRGVSPRRIPWGRLQAQTETLDRLQGHPLALVRTLARGLRESSTYAEREEAGQALVTLAGQLLEAEEKAGRLVGPVLIADSGLTVPLLGVCRESRRPQKTRRRKRDPLVLDIKEG